jgi:hypothetical protein
VSLHTRILAIAAALATVLAGIVAIASPAAAATYSAYVMGYFKESPNQSGDSYALHLAVSNDGLNWMPLNQNNPVATPTAGMQGLRDPYILRRQDGTFVVLATDLLGAGLQARHADAHGFEPAQPRALDQVREPGVPAQQRQRRVCPRSQRHTELRYAGPVRRHAARAIR